MSPLYNRKSKKNSRTTTPRMTKNRAESNFLHVKKTDLTGF
jgi:hypothetical protein